jgi:hypothetical protein
MRGKDMQTTANELRQAGIAIARAREGFDLPVIDVTHPRFAVADDPESIQALRDAVLLSERQHRRVPKFLMRWMQKSAARKSRLARALFGGDATFLDSISTYVMKLGAGNLLPPYDGAVDQRLSAMAHVTLIRLRMQQIAELIAACAVSKLSAAQRRPLHLVDIAGGPAMDAINALILLAQSSRDLLKRLIVIDVLDLDDTGAFFGQAALAELQREGAHLCGLNIELRYRVYDWRATAALEELIEELVAQDAIIIAASEGGLSEYGSDEDIVANLVTLRAGGKGARYVVGSVTRADELRRRLIAESRFKLIPRGVEGFGPLAAQAGFRIGQTRSAVWSDQVALLAEPS